MKEGDPDTMASIKELFNRKKKDVDMTEGSIVRHIILFAVPLLLGNIFQQMYNMVDTWVVGNFVSNEAYSAVGSVGHITNVLIGFFMGLSSGTGVVISQYYGAKRYDKVQETVHTAILMTVVMAVIVTGLGIFMTPYMLQIMKTPAEVVPEAKTYLAIYFSGALGLMVYNMGAGILRAVGDSQRPFYFLVVCAVVNTVLDLVFVLVFHMGVAGVALATIIAQFISAILVVRTLMCSDSCIRLRLRLLAFHKDIFAKIFKVGIPAALQMAITSFSNVFVQSYVNAFGQYAMSGWTTLTKVDQLIMLPRQSISLAVTTFVGQNLGRNQPERAKKGVNMALVITLVTTVVLMIPIITFAPAVVTFFNRTPQVVEIGSMMLRYVMPFQLFGCLTQIYSGALRGSGNSRAPMVIMLCTYVAFRQVYMYVMANFICNEVMPIFMGYPAGWVLCGVLTFIYYKRTSLTKTRLLEPEKTA